MQRVNRLIRLLRSSQYIETDEIRHWKARRGIYLAPGEYRMEQEKEKQVRLGDWLADTGMTVFLQTDIEIPDGWNQEDTALLFKAGGNGRPTHCEALVTVDGNPIQGLDRNRSIVMFPGGCFKKGRASIHIELFNPVGIPHDNLRGFNPVAMQETDPPPVYLEQSSLVLVNRPVQKLLYTLETCKETCMLLDEWDTRRGILLEAMEEAVYRLGIPQEGDLSNQPLLDELEGNLRKTFENTAGFREGTIRAIGQSHIDTAWLWPIKETVRKASRTFSSMCNLMDEYENFKYAQSQPQLFEYVKKHHPKVYERVKKKIKQGNFEIIGGMWVEPDLNIPSGESLVRQLLYGKRFYKEEFNKESRVEWLPDTFGYCASLPQILKKSGTDYFMTTKLNWNDTNRFPNDLFYWEGIDGSSVLSYLHTVLGQETHATEIKKTWKDYKQKEVYPERMLVYGYGDGGGGVTREMLERIERSGNLPGLPDVRFDSVHRFFERIESKSPRLPVWYGDLYLELHRGTFTTHAAAKRNNRKAESLYRETEIWNSFVSAVLGDSYPAEEIEKGWKLLLLNQFHDIVPGTSISEVYELSAKQYKEVFDIGNRLMDSAISSLVGAIDTRGEGAPAVLFNSLGWRRNELIHIQGGEELLTAMAEDEAGNVYPSEIIEREDGNVELSILAEDIPEFGYKTLWLKHGTQKESERKMEKEFSGKLDTAFYEVEFCENGWISRLYDKTAQKTVIGKGGPGNELQLFEDLPTDWDAWDIDPNFECQRVHEVKIQSRRIKHLGSLSTCLEFTWEVSDSTVSQEIVFYSHSRRIDFRTKVDWKEDHKLLKVAFPVNINAYKATYEIPFGSIERPTHTNTSWEQAQFEVCGQRWVDISEGNYGVSLLNDCKYGFDIKGSTMRMSLLRAPKWPDPAADRGMHEFTYSLMPHSGDWRRGETVNRALEIHSPVIVRVTDQHAGELENSKSFITVKSDSAIVDTIKHSEDGEGLILRVYESEGSEDMMTIDFSPAFNTAYGTNLLEEPEESADFADGSLKRKIKPYEICTFLLKE